MFYWLKRILLYHQYYQTLRPTIVPRRRPRGTWLRLERLEDRVTPSAWLVNSVSGAAAAGSGQDGNLAYCVAGANADSSNATITFDATVFAGATTVTLAAELHLGNGSHSVSIDGSGAGPITISGGGAVQDFDVNGLVTTISNLTISGGQSSGFGGGIKNDTGSLTLRNDVISGNTAQYGGGIDNNSTLILIGTTVSGNSSGTFSYSEGAGILNNRGTLVVKDGSIIENNVTSGEGGGIMNDIDGKVTITGSTISGNTAAEDGGGIYCFSTCTLIVNGASVIKNNQAGSSGGGISNFSDSTATVTDSTIASNTADTGGGIANYGNLTVNGRSTVRDNLASDEGGGVFGTGSGTTSISNATISGNTASNGAGVAGVFADLSITCSTIQGNTATTGYGGGVDYIGDSTGNTAVIASSTFASNTAKVGGGGIFTTGTITVTNSTLTRNTAVQGGAMETPFGSITLLASTVSRNIGTYGGGITSSGALTLQNSIVSDNTGAQGIADISGRITQDNGCNLLGTTIKSSAIDPMRGPHDIFTDSPHLAALAKNGGPTDTMALLPDSPAIDAGNNHADKAAGLTFDQRGPGFVRIAGGTADIGAFEVQPLHITVQPAKPIIDVGESDTLQAAVSKGTAPYSYQWFIGASGDTSTPITGATSSSFSASPTGTTTYWVQVTDAVHARDNSSSVTITANPKMTIAIQAAKAVIDQGETDILHVAVSNGTPAYSYQWYIGVSGDTTTPIAGAISSALSIAPTATTRYWVQVIDSVGGKVNSSSTAITVNPPMSIIAQPAPAIINSGDTDTLSVVVTSGTPVYTYQWYVGVSGDVSSPITGATSFDYLASPTSTTRYWVQVTDAANGKINSSSAAITVDS